ncbi:DNA-binding transcriptional LysR family regulator [Sagittula marina]|uniref:DNA-binding transcriptional LysR family regulator n=1 Tax=Sagittula marina TaxID=943940 RepID=A0A7W6GTX2_9RHOB|nr:LysR family transcriptional regulator [Sagittula marina]MBB3987575.1 DNA-binding transcriptional LysR family regulator [Sagittula marina]
MDNWDDLRFLAALARTGTMKLAAQKLGTNTATVSRRIDRLSERLGEPAFIKTPDGWKPSKAVEALIQVAQSFDGQIQSALHSRAAPPEAPVQVKLGCTPFVLRNLLIPGMERHAGLLDGIGLLFADRLMKDGLGDNDIVVQAERPEQGRVITRKVGSLGFRYYRPREVKCDKNWVGFSDALDDNPLQRIGFDHFGRPPRMRVDSMDALKSVIKSMGIAGPLPDVIAAGDPELELLDSNAEPIVSEFWLLYHESRRSDPVIRATANFVLRCFEDEALAGRRLAAE